MTLSTFGALRHLQRPLGTLLSLLALSLLLGATLQPVRAQTPVNVTTYHNDKRRTGQNTQETQLTLANVNPNSFGLLFTLPVDGNVYAQPLYLSQVAIPGKGTHNVLYIATENNSVYAFDADSNLGPNASPLWQVNLGTPVLVANVGVYSIYPGDGITSTPVIDTGTKTIYVVARTQETDSLGNPIYRHRLHALDVTTGQEKFKGPVVISATVKGTGDGTDGNGNVPFNSLYEFNRPALLLAPLTTLGKNGKPSSRNTVFVAFASYGDFGLYHGWVMGYDDVTLKQTAVFKPTPNATTAPSGFPVGGGGIWNGGSGPASDGNSLYYITANGTFDPSTGGFGDSFVRMSTTNGLQLTDYFAPLNQQVLDDDDEDLGSGGCIVLPDAVGSKQHRSLMIGAGKQGNIYLVDRANMGQFNADFDNVVQEVDGQIGGNWSGPAYFNNQVYFSGYGDYLKAFSIKNGVLSSTPVSASSTFYPEVGVGLSVSSNGKSNGIVWALEIDSIRNALPPVLHAYDATNLATELYNSTMVPGRDSGPQSVHFLTPTIANGKVYVGGQYAVGVYGKGQWVITPTITPAPGTYPGAINVTITDIPGASIYYTLGGPTPSSSSHPYTGPFTLINSADLQAIAYAPGYSHSGIASAELLIAPVIGTGTGLLGNYYANTQTPTGTPSDQELDPTINFLWNGGTPGTPPFANFPGQHWSAEWTGMIQAETTGVVTFTAVANDGVRLWVNNLEVINEWRDEHQNGIAYSGNVTLVAGTLYPITIDYYQKDNSSELQLYWSFPGQAMQIVPQSQLYPPN